jgi:hypothetical protein
VLTANSLPEVFASLQTRALLTDKLEEFASRRLKEVVIWSFNSAEMFSGGEFGPESGSVGLKS